MENFARPPVLDVPHEVECIRYQAGLKQKHGEIAIEIKSKRNYVKHVHKTFTSFKVFLSQHIFNNWYVFNVANLIESIAYDSL